MDRCSGDWGCRRRVSRNQCDFLIALCRGGCGQRLARSDTLVNHCVVVDYDSIAFGGGGLVRILAFELAVEMMPVSTEREAKSAGATQGGQKD